MKRKELAKLMATDLWQHYKKLDSLGLVESVAPKCMMYLAVIKSLDTFVKKDEKKAEEQVEPTTTSEIVESKIATKEVVTHAEVQSVTTDAKPKRKYRLKIDADRKVFPPKGDVLNYPQDGSLYEKTRFLIRMFQPVRTSEIAEAFLLYNDKKVNGTTVSFYVADLKRRGEIVENKKVGNTLWYELAKTEVEVEPEVSDDSKLTSEQLIERGYCMDGNKKYEIGNEVSYFDMRGRHCVGSICGFGDHNTHLNKRMLVIGNEGSIQTYKRYTSEVELKKYE